MTSELRFVIDTAVAISAVLFPHSVPRRAFDTAFARGCALVSAATAAELEQVLRRPKFSKYVPEEKRLEFLASYISEAQVVEILQTITECRDPKDNKFLELAVSGNASHIISGDADLLVMNPFRGIAIVTPQSFLASLAGT